MMEYTMDDLLNWNEKIEKVVKHYGLNCYPQEFEVCDHDDMIAYEAYIGMPSHYPHWSYGKSFERTKALYQHGMTGLPYEMVINSNPCLAYLMRDNTLLLQILTIAHVYGHNDFFANNRMFLTATDASRTIEKFKTHADIVRGYISDPSIGYDKVERILNAAHALMYQTSKIIGEKRLSESEKRQRLLEKVKNIDKPSANPLLDYNDPSAKEDKAFEMIDASKIPPEPEEDLLFFVANYGNLRDWERNLINIVREETLYFLPQIETKIMNEGWASYWHYTILKDLNLSQGLHTEFLIRHNQVIRPHLGQINPYFVGFKVFEDLIKTKGLEEAKRIRYQERDSSFLRLYLTKDLCEEMNLFEYDTQVTDNDYVYKKEHTIKEIADEHGWKSIRNRLANSVGLANIPTIQVIDWDRKSGALYLEHEYEGRELELKYAQETIKHMVDLWGGAVGLETKIQGKSKTVMCDAKKNIIG